MALRRDERPDEGYWKDFLTEFHQRQREQAAEKSAAAAAFERMKAWFGEMGPSKWAYGAGLAYAAVTIGFLLTPKSVDYVNPSMTPVNHEVKPKEAKAPVEQLDQLDLSPSTQGTAGEQVF